MINPFPSMKPYFEREAILNLLVIKIEDTMFLWMKG